MADVRVMRADKSRSVEKGRIIARFNQERLDAYEWTNVAGDYFDWHVHEFRKVLYCLAGSILFHTPDGDIEVGAGDRIEVDAGVRHAATVGPEGVTCMEAAG